MKGFQLNPSWWNPLFQQTSTSQRSAGSMAIVLKVQIFSSNISLWREKRYFQTLTPDKLEKPVWMCNRCLCKSKKTYPSSLCLINHLDSFPLQFFPATINESTWRRFSFINMQMNVSTGGKWPFWIHMFLKKIIINRPGWGRSLLSVESPAKCSWFIQICVIHLAGLGALFLSPLGDLHFTHIINPPIEERAAWAQRPGKEKCRTTQKPYHSGGRHLLESSALQSSCHENPTNHHFTAPPQHYETNRSICLFIHAITVVPSLCERRSERTPCCNLCTSAALQHAANFCSRAVLFRGESWNEKHCPSLLSSLPTAPLLPSSSQSPLLSKNNP